MRGRLGGLGEGRGKDQGVPEGLGTRQVSRGLALEANGASMATPVTVTAMQVGVDKHNLRGAVGPVHQEMKWGS
jgi:hypothetical protein